MPSFASQTFIRTVQRSVTMALSKARPDRLPLFQKLASLFTPPARSRRQFRSNGQRTFAAAVGLESLESRVLLAAYAGSGTTMTLTLAANETVTVVSTGSDTYTFTLGSGSWSGSGTTTGMSASGTTLTASSTAKSTFSSFVITKASATAGTDVIFGNSAAAYTDNFTVTQTGTGLADAITFNGSTSFSDSNTLTVTTNRRIEFTTGAVVQSADGNITMTANSAGTSTGTFVGLLMNGATLKTTGTGNLSLTAKGGATYTAATSNNGLWVLDSLIETTSGSITISGTGGTTNTAPDNMTCAGMEFVRSTVKSTSAGNITLNGTGGSGASNTGDCDGIGLEESVTITTTGAGQISMTGNAKNNGQGVSSWDNSMTVATKNVITAGSGGLTINATSERGNAVGVSGADITEIIFDAISGPISITASSTRGDALYMDNQQLGSASTTSITIVASGGTTLASQLADVDGVILDNLYMQTSGAVSLTATGGNYDGTANGVGIDALALNVNAGSISMSGTCIGNSKGVWMADCYLTATGDITLTGTNAPNMSGASSGDNDGIYLTVGTLSSGGILSLTGTGKAGGEGVELVDYGVSAASVSVLGNTENADAVILNVTLSTSGNVSITGTCSGGTGDNDGVVLSSSVLDIGGDATISGTAKDGGEAIEIVSTTLDAAALQMTATSVNSDSLDFSAATINADSVVMTASRSALFVNSSITSSTGLSVTANNAATAAGTFTGITVTNSTLSSQGSGNLSLTGKGGTTTVTVGGNEGIATFGTSVIESQSGSITLTGTGGSYNGTDTNVTVAGVNLNTTTVRSTAGGNVSISGVGATGVANNGDCDGVNFEQLTVVSTTGTGSISITGTGKGGGEGIDIEDNTNNQVLAGSGGLTLNGTAPSAVGLQLAGSSNTWLLLDAVNGPISITATSETDDALDLRNAQLGSGSITNLTINATGGSVTASGDDDGIFISNIAATITGTLSLTGTAGDSGESTEIVNSAFTAASATLTANKNITLTSTSVTTLSGDLSVSANSADASTGTFVGISLSGATLSAQAAGNVTLTGRGGKTVVTVAGNDGITASANTVIETVTGTISITGIAGSYNGSDSGTSVNGILLDTTTVRSTNGGNISMTGTGAFGAASSGDADGVNLNNACLISTNASGSISITGNAKANGEGIDTNDNLKNNQILAGSGGVTLTGTSELSTAIDAAGSSSTWVFLDATNGPLTINGTSSYDDSVTLKTMQLGSGSITSFTSSGTGGNVTASGDDDGIYFDAVVASITGAISLTGIAGATGEGMEILNSNLSAASFSLTASTGNSDAMNVSGSTLTATGSITMSATCTGGTGDNDGIIFGSSTITAGTTMSLTGVAKDTGEAVQITGATLSATTFQSNGTGVNSIGFEMDGGSISATTVTITTSTASGSAIATRLYNSASITATGSSGLTINNTGGLNGLQMDTSAALRATNGPVTVTADKNISINTGTITSDGVGSINLTANAFGWSGVGAAVNAGTGTVTLVPTTANWPIVLGAADTGTAIGLESAELSLITAGTLLIGTTGNTQPITISSPVSATTAGNITLRSAGGIAPTATGTDITLGSGKSLSFPSSTSILIAVSGNTADTGYSQLKVAGTLNLTGTMLSLSGSYVPVSGDVLTVADATTVTGTFTGLANNAVTSLNSEPLQVNYTAGSGTLTAYVAPGVTTHPASTGVTAGTVVSFTAAATGVPVPTVQWQVSTNGGSTWSNISGETSGTYSFTAAAGDTGKQYRAVFTNAEGTANTTAATLLVGTLPVFTSRSVMTAGEGVGTGLYVTATASPAPTFSITSGSLPAGLTLDPATGLLSGTPSAGTAGGSSQNYNVTILASNGIGSGTLQNLTITVTTGIISFDVSKGLSQRSYIRYVDLTLANAVTAAAIVSSGTRMSLTRSDLDGNGSTAVSLSGFVKTVGGRIAIDFGTVGIGNARNTSLADGYYKLAVDLDNDGLKEAEFAFFRMFGDLNGDREVNSTDLAIATTGARSAYSAEADANGDGFVTSADVLYVRRTLNRRLRNGLWLAD